MATKLDYTQVIQQAFDETSGGLKMQNVSSLVPESYDEMVLSYTGDDLTGVVYKLASTTVATLTLSYTSGKLTGVVKS